MVDQVSSTSEHPVSDEAVKRKTGKAWSEWFAELDDLGAQAMRHRDIARRIAEDYPEIGGWWSQMVTVGYERARGLRVKHETLDGFSVSVSRTIGVPVEVLFEAWDKPANRDIWLPAPAMHVRKATPAKSMRITWDDGTSVDAYFYAKGDGRSQVTVQHSKLSNAAAVDQTREFWGAALGRLKATLES